MALPAGFKVNGISVSREVHVTAKVQKIKATLDELPLSDLLTSFELSARARVSSGGADMAHPALLPYREKVDGKLFWGSPETITNLRAQLNQPEETSEENI
jgi:hypothetical protein